MFCTVETGIAGHGDMKDGCRVGGKALIYFEVVVTLAWDWSVRGEFRAARGTDSMWSRELLDTKGLADMQGKAERHRARRSDLSANNPQHGGGRLRKGDTLQ